MALSTLERLASAHLQTPEPWTYSLASWAADPVRPVYFCDWKEDRLWELPQVFFMPRGPWACPW